MSTSQSSPVTEFRDSAKVLRDILGIIDRHEEVVTPSTDDKRAERPSDAVGQTALSTLNLIKEVVRNARTQTRIPNRSSRTEAVPVEPVRIEPS